MKNFTFKVLLLLAMFISATSIYAQSTVNFAGVWIKDNAKSDEFYKDFDITCTIKQSPQEISIEETFFSKSGEKITTRLDSYTLDGKETSVKEEGGIKKKSAKWSADKKTLTVSNTTTYGSEVLGSYKAYSLSENGRVLNVLTTDANPLTGLKVNQLFNKK